MYKSTVQSPGWLCKSHSVSLLDASRIWSHPGDVLMLPDPTGKNVFPFTVKTSTKADHNYCDSLRPMHDPFMLFAKPIASTVVLLLIQHYCCCVKPTVTDGNPAIIYHNSLCATKWKQLSQSTQRSVEQITTHNSLWVWEIYFLPDSLSLCVTHGYYDPTLFLLAPLLLLLLAFLVGRNPVHTRSACSLYVATTSFFLSLFRPLTPTSISVPLFFPPLLNNTSSEQGGRWQTNANQPCPAYLLCA